MRKVSELLASRPSKSSFVVSSDTPVLGAIQQLVYNNLSSLVVMDCDTPVGIFSPKGLMLRLARGATLFDGLTVHDVMSLDIAYATPETDLLECMVMMTGYVNGAMPVLRQGKLAGIVEMREVTREVMCEQQATLAASKAKASASSHGSSPILRTTLRRGLELLAKH